MNPAGKAGFDPRSTAYVLTLGDALHDAVMTRLETDSQRGGGGGGREREREREGERGGE